MNLSVDLSLNEKAVYLRTLPSIRERCSRVHDLAKQGKLRYFDYHPENETKAIDFCAEIINRDFGEDYSKIPPHGRWRHLDAGNERIKPMISSWSRSEHPPDLKEQARRLIDLFVVSVLLDAGAGSKWSYLEKSSGKRFYRSEGLGVASFDMFQSGFFSGDAAQPHQVNASGLQQITARKTADLMQVSDDNPMVGLEGRTELLIRLAAALKSSPDFFGHDARPGNIVDFLERESLKEGSKTIIPVSALWHCLIEGLNPIWPPSRTTLAGVSLGDVWPCPTLSKSNSEGDNFVPFHKLTGWMTYSLIEPIHKILGWEVQGTEDMTGLPEYRNGGLLVDLGVLSLKPGSLPIDPTLKLPTAEPSHPAIVEWRAMTVIELDRIAEGIRKRLKYDFSLPQLLESATWKGGRELAREKRPATSGSPIEIKSDGTVF